MGQQNQRRLIQRGSHQGVAAARDTPDSRRLARLVEAWREWRLHRRLTQIGLALDANISQRHLSFVESGRSRPSRDMALRLTRQLGVLLRDRNVILHAAGYAPAFAQRALDAPELSVARETIDRILLGHNPHPALAVDRHWSLLSANSAASHLLSDVKPRLLQGNANVLRLSLHPEGLAPHIQNLAQWRSYILTRLGQEIAVSADQVLVALREELAAYPHSEAPRRKGGTSAQQQEIAVPLQLKTSAGTLSFLSTTTVFGTAVDVTLSEVTIEAFYPADRKTVVAMAAVDDGA